MKRPQKTSDAKNFWKLWSVQLAALSAGLSAAAVAYGATAAISPALVVGIPQWVGVVLTGGAMLTAFASMYTRTILQPKLVERHDAGEIPENQEAVNEEGQV